VRKALTPFARALLLSAESEGIVQIEGRYTDHAHGRCAIGVLLEAVFGTTFLPDLGLSYDDADWAYSEFRKATGLKRDGAAWAEVVRLNNLGKGFAEIADLVV
jgi:hypothetical protein